MVGLGLGLDVVEAVLDALVHCSREARLEEGLELNKQLQPSVAAAGERCARALAQRPPVVR